MSTNTKHYDAVSAVREALTAIDPDSPEGFDVAQDIIDFIADRFKLVSVTVSEYNAYVMLQRPLMGDEWDRVRHSSAWNRLLGDSLDRLAEALDEIDAPEEDE